LDRWKHVERSITAFAIARKQIPGLELHVAGSQTPDSRNRGYLDELRNLAKDLRCAESVTFLGHVESGVTALRDADFLLQLSDFEPFGLSVAEALRERVPAIVSNNGGATEIVQDGRSGYVVEPTDAGAVASRICALATDPELRTRLGEYGRIQVEQRFDAERQSKSVWDLVTDAAGQ
jgi:trehalose synthase